MPATSLFLLFTLIAQENGIDAYREGRFHDARLALEATLKTNPLDASARAFLAMTAAAEHDCAPAAKEFQTASPFSRQAGLAAADCYAATDKTTEAFTLLADLDKKFPGDPDVLYETAKLHRKAWDQFVAELFRKAPQSYRVNQLSAEVFETEGKYGEAAAQSRIALGKNPEALNLHFRLGRCLLLDSPSPENLETALAEFQAELKLNPTDAVADYQIAQILTTQQKPEDALTYYQRALTLKPDFVEALIAIGRIHAQRKQYDSAIPLFEQAIQLQPANEAAHYNLMLAYRNTGRAADALAQKKELDRLQKPPEGEFTEFLKKLGQPK